MTCMSAVVFVVCSSATFKRRREATKNLSQVINRSRSSTALVLPAVALDGVLRPELGPGVAVSPACWELSPVACGRDLD